MLTLHLYSQEHFSNIWFEELRLNYIAAGHYNSEKLGVQALCDYIADKFGLESEFVDVPNPV